MTAFPAFVEPVTINGKTFEKSDVPEAVKLVSAQLCAAQDRPANQKLSAARFILAAEQAGCVTLKSNIRKYCQQLLK